MSHIIDTKKAIDAIHEAYNKVNAMPDDSPDRDPLYRTANSALSATLPYLRNPHAPAKKPHFDAVEALYRTMGTSEGMVDQDVA